jgi:hypothetical protein
MRIARGEDGRLPARDAGKALPAETVTSIANCDNRKIVIANNRKSGLASIASIAASLTSAIIRPGAELKALRSAVCLPLFFEERGRNGRAETAYRARWLVYSAGGIRGLRREFVL